MLYRMKQFCAKLPNCYLIHNVVEEKQNKKNIRILLLLAWSPICICPLIKVLTKHVLSQYFCLKSDIQSSVLFFIVQMFHILSYLNVYITGK